MRTKRAILTYLSDLIPQILLAIIGLVKAAYFVGNLGTAVNGLYSLYSQIMMYLTLVDGGLSSAILYRLYKPIAENDVNRISSILSGSRRIFQIIGIVIFAGGVVVSFFIPVFIKDNPFEFIYLQTTFMLYLISSVISYFTIANKTIFEAYQRKYVTNTITQIISITKGIIETILIMQGFGLYAIIGLLGVSNLTTSLIIYLLSKKDYPNINFNCRKKSYEILSDVKHLLVHKIGTLIAYNIDIVLVSKMINIQTAAIYTAYTYIVDNITNIVGKLTASAIAGVGDLISSEKERCYDIFKEFNSLSFYLGTIICIPLFYVINPFIQIWHKGRIETTSLIALMFVLNLLYYIIRMPLITFVNSAGLFKETKICPIIESVINLTLSIILVQIIGLPGLLIGTFVAYICSDYCIRPVLIYKHIFEKKVKSYYIENFVYIGIFIVLAFAMSFIVSYFPMNTYISWFLSSLFLFAVNAGLALIAYLLFKKAYFFARVKKMLQLILKKKGA